MRANKYHRAKLYPIAVGRVGFETPAGMYFIERKDKNPQWLPPDEDWVGPDLRGPDGKPVPIPGGDPRNPLAGAFLAISGGNAVGFHGIPAYEDASIGTAASHGCLRMHVEDVLDLYRRVRLGTPVFIY